jgi:hypothetical protein
MVFKEILALLFMHNLGQKQHENNTYDILHFTFLFSLFVLVSAAGPVEYRGFFSPTELFDKGTYQKEGSEGQHI